MFDGTAGVRFNNVTFSYEETSRKILHDFSYDFPPESITAIGGETGAGKTTLLRLLIALMSPREGSIELYNDKEQHKASTSTRGNIVYIPQGNSLISGTIRENLLMGNPNATEEQIREAIRMVSAEEVIAHLEKGLDTDVGEGGDLLSTGEKQLISFARAILADPRILILDEATASVDTMTEAKIQAAMETVTKGRTTLMIAHRLSTVRNADLILVVKNGRVVEQGSHTELLAKKGYYHELYTRQYEDEATARILS